MDCPVEHERFEQKQLMVQTHPFLGAKLFLDGAEVKRRWFKFEVSDDAGTPTVIRFRSGLDLQPRLVVDGGDPIQLMEPLPWYAYAVSYPPLLLLFTGGAIGGGLGGLAVATSLTIFRTELPTAAKIGASILVGLASIVAFLVVAGGLHVLRSLLG